MMTPTTMRTEKVVLSFIAILIGLLVAGVSFYFYQSTKSTTAKVATPISLKLPSTTPEAKKNAFDVIISSPTDESLVAKKTVTISGKTTANATILLTTPVDNDIASASATGDFTDNLAIDDGENEIDVTAIDSKGNEVTKKVTVTYSTDNF